MKLSGDRVTSLDPGSGAHLWGVWGSSPEDIFVVGESGTILRYDGSRWWSQSSAPREGLNDGAGYSGRPGRPAGGFYGLWGGSSSAVFAVGHAGTALFFDGEQWRPQQTGVTERLRDVWGAADDDVWAVGDHGTVLRYDGERWSEVEVETTEDLAAVWGSGAEDVFIVGAAGTILRWNGEELELRLGVTHASLHDVWGRSANEVWAVGQSGTLLRWDGVGWTVSEPVRGRHLLAIWGTRSGDLFLAGRAYGVAFREDTVLRLVDGNVEEAGLASRSVDALWGDSRDDLYAAGLFGTYHYDGRDWTLLEIGVSEPIRALWGEDDRVIAVGAFGVIERQLLGERAASPAASPAAAEPARRDATVGDGGVSATD
jgi:hypothetical protein